MENNCRIECCYNGQDACKKIDEQIESGQSPYDLIFMDIDMPIMNGFDATKYIRSKISLFSTQRKLNKIIMCSAYESEEQR